MLPLSYEVKLLPNQCMEGAVAKVKAWKHGESGQPSFSSDFAIVQKAVLQVTDIKTNRNKYYAIELHSHGVDNKGPFRVFTHYGRTDDLGGTDIQIGLVMKAAR